MATETALSRIEPNCSLPSIRPANSLEAAIRNTLPFPKTSLPTATDAATRLIGCYPNGKPSEPETYIAAMVAVLAGYPSEIVAQVCDPVHGVASKTRFLPTVAELTDACEIAMMPLRRQWLAQKELTDERAKRNAPKALTDAAAAQRVRDGLATLAKELGNAPDPVPPKRIGNEPVSKPVSDHAARVIADIAKRKSEQDRST